MCFVFAHKTITNNDSKGPIGEQKNLKKNWLICKTNEWTVCEKWWIFYTHSDIFFFIRICLISKNIYRLLYIMLVYIAKLYTVIDRFTCSIFEGINIEILKRKKIIENRNQFSNKVWRLLLYFIIFLKILFL